MGTVSEVRVDRVEARPVVMARVGYALGVVVFLVFVVVSLVMRRDNAGAYFGPKDQIATAVVGVFAGAAFWPLSRPRLVADADGVHTRGFFGSWRTVPWELIRAVEFPSSVRFARIALSGEETLAIYAVQRIDRERSVAAMRGLRALLAAAKN